MSTGSNEIRITCNATDFLDIDKIESLQRGLKSISKESMEKLKNSIKQYGFSFPVFVWKQNEIYYSIDGIHRCKALKELSEIEGYQIPDQVPVVYIQAKDKKEAKELLLAATSQYASVNKDYLMQEYIKDLNLENLTAAIEISQIDIETLILNSSPTRNDDEIPEEVESITRKGYLWELGRHRLLCADSTKIDDVNKLMQGNTTISCITDPPYSVNYENIKRKKNAPTRKQMGDVYKDPKAEDLLKFVDLIPSDVLVMTYGLDKKIHVLSQFFSDWELLYNCVWVKQHFAFNMNRNYQMQHEPILIFRRKKYKNSYFNVPKNQSSVFNYDRMSRNKEHPTIKPLELYVRLVEYHSPRNDNIYEPFCGSGTTLIACEKTDRKCYGMEIEPHYCDVITKRYHDWCLSNGRKPEIKLNGKPYDKYMA